jgi:hypothetical protein
MFLCRYHKFNKQMVAVVDVLIGSCELATFVADKT